MPLSPYIDIHNHKISQINNKSVSICSFFVQNYECADNQSLSYYTVGLHPWHADNVDFDEALAKMEQIIHQPNCIAVGEIGLDHVSTASYNKQLIAFERQLCLAQKVGLPVIIHNVKSLAEIVGIIKKQKFNYPIIFHDFRGKLQMAEQLISLGAYLSFGVALMHSYTNDVLQLVPTDRVFFETDDSNYTIEEVYATASKVSNIPIDTWKDIVYNNFTKIFKRYNAELA